MSRLIPDIWEVLKRYRRTWAKLGIAAAVFILAAAVAFVRVSESPEFCLGCHIMQPYYDSWATSAHKGVNCLTCHYPPTLGGHVSSKIRAISQVVQYFTGTYGTRLWAEIGDDACLQPGCHDTRLLSGKVTFKRDITFDHAFHLGELPHGKKLRCTSCHSQIVVGTHLEVTESTCFICHFKNATLGVGTAECLTCHGPPTTPVEYGGLKIDHTEYLDRKVPCVQCHVNVVRGDGAVPQTRCYSCHADRSHTVTDPVMLHEIHVTNHKVECFECHNEIEHGSLEISPLLSPNCVACHGALHSPQEKIYVGTGGVDTVSVPGEMFAAQVTCAACHRAGKASPAAPLPPGTFPRATSEECVSCHGVVFANVLDNWQRETRAAYAKARTLTETAKATVYAAGATGPERAYGRTLIAEAEQNLELVAADATYGAHNIIYTNALIETAVAKADAAARAAGSRLNYDAEAFAVPKESDTCAWRCHFGLERETISVGGKTFDHGVHVAGGKNKCAACHDLEKHGTTFTSSYNCAACHHAGAGNTDCSSCHGDATRLVVNFNGRRFDHGAHLKEAAVACATCHPPERPTVVAGDCNGCHHKPGAKACADCHAVAAATRAGTGAPGGVGKPGPMPNVTCVQCHKQPPVKPADGGCTACHPAGYAAVYKTWRKSTTDSYRALSIKTEEAAKYRGALAGVTVDGETGAAVYTRAVADLAWAGGDNSWGAHNAAYVTATLGADAEKLERVLTEVRR